MAKQKDKPVGGEMYPTFDPKKHTFDSDQVRYYPKSGNCYNRDGKYIGKGILTGGVLEIIYKSEK